MVINYTDPRVVDLFKKYDAYERGYLLKENFVDFYSEATKEKSDTVWSNL